VYPRTSEDFSLFLIKVHLLHRAFFHQLHNVQATAEVLQIQLDRIGTLAGLAFAAVNRLSQRIDHPNLVIAFFRRTEVQHSHLAGRVWIQADGFFDGLT